MRTKPKLYLFVGYPGSGKTTVAKYIEEQTNATHLWADQERQIMFGYPTHSLDESQQLYDALDKKAEQLLARGKNVIFDTNFNYRADRQLMRNLGSRLNAKTYLIWLITPKKVAKTRALHHTHRDKNGYLITMTEQEFNHLCDHLEPPTATEQPIKIDGTDIDYVALKKQLNL